MNHTIKFFQNCRYFARGERYTANGMELNTATTALQLKPIRAKDSIGASTYIEVPYKDIEKVVLGMLNAVPKNLVYKNLSCFVLVAYSKLGILERWKLRKQGYSVRTKTAGLYIGNYDEKQHSDLIRTIAKNKNVIDLRQHFMVKIPGFNPNN